MSIAHPLLIALVLVLTACGGGGSDPKATSDPVVTSVDGAFTIDPAVLAIDGTLPDPGGVLSGGDSMVARIIPAIVTGNPDLAPLLDGLDDFMSTEQGLLEQLEQQLISLQLAPKGVNVGAPLPETRSFSTRDSTAGNRAGMGGAMASTVIILDMLGKDSKEVLNFSGAQSQGDVTLGMELNLGGPPTAAREFTLKMKLEREGVTLEGTTTGSLKGDPCPDERGEVHGEFTYSVVASGGGAAITIGSQTEVKGTLTGYVNDAALLTGFEVDATASDAAQRANGHNSFVELRTNGRIDGDFPPPGSHEPQAGTPAITSSNSSISVLRHSQDATEADAASAAEVALSAYQFASTVVQYWQSQWRSGACVKIQADAPGEVDPGKHVKIQAKVVHRDGQALELPIDLSLTGPSSVNPTRIDKAPGTVTYIASDEHKRTGTISWKSTSRRGIGTLTTAITTKPKLAYRVAGGADDLVVDTMVCDVWGPFTLEGSGVVQQFSPSGGSGGSYSYSGTMSGFAVHGSGTYTITFPNGPEATGSMTATGEGSVETEAGTISNTGTENYTLAPFEPDETQCPTKE